MEDLIGKTIGNYQIVAELGRGGMAVVYRAYQPSLNRHVAIKVLPAQLALDREFVERFLREARAAAGLRHPNIVIVHDVGQDKGLYYIVMEYLEGRTLKQLIEQEGPLPPDRVIRILEQVAAALDYAHQRGFVHRDVKPANIFVGEGDRVTLTDFGIAKAATETQQLTRTGILMGTPEYMSPEQAAGGPIDARTDLYALGVVLYQMLVGRVPFQGTTPHATLHAVIYEQPPPPRLLNPRIPPAVEGVVLKAMAKRPEQRFQRGADMVAALRAALAGQAPPAAVTPPRQPSSPREMVGQPPARSSPMLWILAGTAGVLVLLLIALVAILAGGRKGPATTIPTTAVAVAWKTIAPTSEWTPSAAPSDTPPPPATTAAPAPTTPEVSGGTAIPPTDTPTSTPTPKPPTHTPTSTPTRTPTPTHTPTPTVPPCPFEAHGLFAGLWQSYREELGCPLSENPKVIQDAEQAFERGHMFWRQDNDHAYVVYESGSLSGTYQDFVDMWEEGDPEYSCAASPPPDRVQPKRGFGAVWCSLGGPSATIGWGLGDEQGFGPGYGDPTVQDFEHGFIFRDSDGKNSGKAYVFFSQDNTFKRVNY